MKDVALFFKQPDEKKKCPAAYEAGSNLFVIFESVSDCVDWRRKIIKILIIDY